MKTNRLLAIFMATCIGGVSAFAQPTNDACSGAIGLTEGAECVIYDNVGATFGPPAEPTPACWASAPDNTVWFSFSPSSDGFHTFSSDNGINNLNTDVQFALYEGSCGALTAVACNEDAGDVNVLASIITADLDFGKTYYLQVDVFGTGTGQFCLNVNKNAVPVNNCPNKAIDITSFLNGVSASNPFATQAHIFNVPGDSLADAPMPHNSNNGNKSCDNSLTGDSIFDVWFKYNASILNADVFLNVYPNNGGNFYGIQAYSPNGDPFNSCSDFVIAGLDISGCAIGEGVPESGSGMGDESVNDFVDHPRLDLSVFSGVVYLRVFQYTRVDGANPPNTAAPSSGFFNLVPEYANGDGFTADNCDGTVRDLTCAGTGNYTATLSNGSNAGLNGGILPPNATSGVPAENGEPSGFNVDGTTSRFQRGCDGNDVLLIAASQTFNNNSGYYAFSVADFVSTVTLPDTLADVTLFDSLVVIMQDSIAPGIPASDVVLPSEDIRLILETCGGLTVGGGMPIPGDLPIVCDEVTTVCGADVLIRLEGLNYYGVNGATAEFYVLPQKPTCPSATPP